MGTAEDDRDGPDPADRLVSAVPARIQGPTRLLAYTLRDAMRDRAPGLAAEIAFFAILSLPAMLLTIVAGVSFLDADQSAAVVEALVSAARRVFSPATVSEVVEPTLERTLARLTSEQRVDVLSISFAASLYTASRAVRVVLDTVAIAYDLEDRRPSVLNRVYGFLATLGLLLLGPVLVPLLLVGPGLGQRLASASLVPDVVATAWRLAYFPSLTLLLVAAVAVLYHLAAPWWTPWRRDLPGALLTVVLWLLGSNLLRVYASRSITGDELYGPLAGPLVLMVWLYVLAFSLLLGAELNAEIERLHPSPNRPDSADYSDRLTRTSRRIGTKVRDAVTDRHHPVRDRPVDDPTPADAETDAHATSEDPDVTTAIPRPDHR